jgi:eukaryotic-like serine/threonine-protein kinase
MAEMISGAVVAKQYRLERALGEGGMGVVWAATHLATGNVVALKFLKGVAATTPALHKRFFREARAAMAVRHPNVVRIHEVTRDDDGLPVMVMDYLQGESLGNAMERIGILSLPDLGRVLLPVISAVGTAHAVGIVHRDLKPDNIFILNGDARQPEVRVLDFGIAKLTANDGDAAQTAGLTGTGSMMGTPYYMSPEQVFGDKDVDHRADIWSLGVIMYECLAGRRPVDGENLGQLLKIITTGEIAPIERVAPHLPPEICALVNRMLAVSKRARPSDLREVYATLRRHTDAHAQSFGAATVVMHASSDPMGTGPNLRQATLPLLVETGATLSATAVPARKGSFLPLLGVGLALAACAGGIAVYALGPRSSRNAATASAQQGEDESPPKHKATIDPVTPKVDETPSKPLPPVVSASIAPVPSTLPPVVAAEAPKLPKVAATAKTGTTATALAPPTTTIVPTSKPTTGGVVTEVPF